MEMLFGMKVLPLGIGSEVSSALPITKGKVLKYEYFGDFKPIELTSIQETELFNKKG